MKIDINILASADIHGHYMPWDYSLDELYKKGSLAQISSIVNEHRQEYKNTILADIGDMFQGNCSEIFCNDDVHPAIVAMNEMGYDIWEMGNHEYGYGTKNLLRFIKQFSGEVIAANIYKDGNRFHKPYVIIEKEGIKIAFVGLITSLINKFEKGSDDMSSIVATDMKDELRLVKKELIGKADCIIGLIHAGISNENGQANTGIYDLLNDEDCFAAIFCAHFHEHINTKINDTIVLESGKFGSAIANLRLSFEKNDDTVEIVDRYHRLIYIDENIPIDKKIVKKLETFHQKARQYSNEEIGILKNHNMKSEEDIKGIANFRIKATALTDFILEVIRYYGKADIAMLQLDNDYAGIDYGVIRRKDINKNYSYVSGGITSYEISGKALKKILDYSAKFYNTSKKGDINISFNQSRLEDKYSSNYFFSNLKYDIDLRDKNEIRNLRYEDGRYVKDDDRIIFASTKYTMDILKSSILQGYDIKKIYASKDILKEKGSIRNLMIKYIKDVLKNEVDTTCKESWKIIRYEVDKNIEEIVVKLINKGYIKLANSKDNTYKNIKSINIYDKVDENDKEIEKLGIDIYKFETKEELYMYAYNKIQECD